MAKRLEFLKHSLGLAAIYGIVHALVDAVTVTTTYAAVLQHRVAPETAVTVILMYDIIAFASQPLFGALADRLGRMRWLTGAGVTLCIAGALLLPFGPFPAAVVAGIGNALFHLGAGVISMSVQPGRAAGPGVFVGPGTLGLAFGMWWGRLAGAVPILLLAALGASVLIPLLLPHPDTVDKDSFPTVKEAAPPSLKIGVAAMLLLLFSIVFRSLVGHAGSHACPKVPAVLFALAGAGCLGKICGGLLSDRLGWLNVSVGALLLAGPLIAFGGGNPYLIGLGGGLFQMTMPVTLVAAAALMPGRPALVFGLNCLAFVGGALPVFSGVLKPYYTPVAFLSVTAVAVAAVFSGLYLLKPRLVMKYGPKAPSAQDVLTNIAP